MTENFTQPPSFVLDVHLARLSKYLRMLGLDCLWRANFIDSELLQISNTEKRFLLTRDRALFQSSQPSLGYYVHSVNPTEQLKEIVLDFKLGNWIRNGLHILTRCLICNTLLQSIPMNQVPNTIPQEIRIRFNRFYLCPTCRRIYWEGSHFDRMKGWLKLIAEVDPMQIDSQSKYPISSQA